MVSTYDDTDLPCDDKLVNTKCMLLDIRISQNSEQLSDLNPGDWFIFRPTNNEYKRLLWGRLNNDECLGFDSPKEALRFYLAHSDDKTIGFF